MKISASLALLALIIFISGANRILAQSSTPYLETASFSILRAFVTTGVTSTTTINSSTATLPSSPGPIDPDQVRPKDRITTDVGTPIYHRHVGDQTYWVIQTQYAVKERLAKAQRNRLRTLLADPISNIDELRAQISQLEDQIAQLPDSPDQLSLSLQLNEAKSDLSLLLDFVSKQSLVLFRNDAELIRLDRLLQYAKEEFTGQGDDWELTAVRAPQRTVDAAVHTSYSIFLTRIDRVRKALSRSYDTGLRLTPLYAVGSSVETLNPNGVTRATGAYTIHFEILFDHDLSPATELTNVNFTFGGVSLHLLPKGSLALAEEEEAFNGQERLQTLGSGYLTCSLRSSPGPLAAVVPTGIRMTGSGSWAATRSTSSAAATSSTRCSRRTSSTA